MNESVRAETFPLRKINPASSLPVIPSINKKTHSKAAGLQGGDEWNRTIDTRIFSPLLYQLSYITSSFECAKIFKKCIYKKIMQNKLN